MGHPAQVMEPGDLAGLAGAVEPEVVLVGNPAGWAVVAAHHLTIGNPLSESLYRFEHSACLARYASGSRALILAWLARLRQDGEQ